MNLKTLHKGTTITPAGKRNHPGQPCGPCVLCTKEKIIYTHPADWNEAAQLKLTEVSNISVNKYVYYKNVQYLIQTLWNM